MDPADDLQPRAQAGHEQRLARRVDHVGEVAAVGGDVGGADARWDPRDLAPVAQRDEHPLAAQDADGDAAALEVGGRGLG